VIVIQLMYSIFHQFPCAASKCWVATVVNVKRAQKTMSKPPYRKISLAEIRESVSESMEDAGMQRLKMFLCLVPVLGFFPALWTLYRGQGSREERSLSRLVVTLSLGWLLSVVLLNTGAQAVHSAAIPLLLTSALLSSGYFVVNLWLMVRLWQRKQLKLPVISRVSDRLP